MALVNHRIGTLSRAIENANRVPSLINRDPVAFPNNYYSDESKYLLGTTQDPNKADGFVCGSGMDKIGGTRKVIP